VKHDVKGSVKVYKVEIYPPLPPYTDITETLATRFRSRLNPNFHRMNSFVVFHILIPKGLR
jgi:hypothetical protein